MRKRGRPRNDGPSYWPSRDGYYANVDGASQYLGPGPDDGKDGPNYMAAKKRLYELMFPDQGKGTDSYLLGSLAAKYRAHLRAISERRLRTFDLRGGEFFDLHSDLPIGRLKATHVTAWLTGKLTWNPTSRSLGGKSVNAALNWAAGPGDLIGVNPISGKLKLPQQLARGDEVRMSDRLRQLLIDNAANDQFRLILRAIRWTGCRPIEARKADVRHYRPGQISLPWQDRTGGYVHKTAKSRKHRVIYLPRDVDEDIQAALGERRDGPLFLTPRGKRWSEDNLKSRFKDTMARPAVTEHLEENGIDRRHVTLYSFRHSVASDMLDAGHPAHDVAELLGTSVSKLEANYGHLLKSRIQDSYLRFVEEQTR